MPADAAAALLPGEAFVVEIRMIFDAIADLAPGIHRTGGAARLRHGWLNGIKDLPVRYGSAS